MKKTVKILAFVLCAVMLVVGSVFGTYAYLTSTTDEIQNTFTFGKVAITLTEAKVTEYGEEVVGADRVKANTYKLIPGHTYTKDPTVYVEAGSEECYLYVKVVNNIAAIEDPTNTIAAQIGGNGWTALPDVANVYYKVVDARNATDDIEIPVFGSFKIAETANVSGFSGVQITVKAYACQKDGFDTAKEAWTGAQFN